MMIRSILMPLVLLLPSTLHAQHSGTMPCDSAKTTLDMRRCASQALEEGKRDLDKYLKEARRVASKSALLDSAQAAWERYRDIACRAAGSEYEGGTIKPVVVLNCLLDLTRKRVHELYDDYLGMSDTPLPEPKP